jgi:hypothetical protein
MLMYLRHCRWDRILLLLFVAIAVEISGCAKGRRPMSQISGKVTYRGKPLPFGTVMFQPEYGQYATGVIQPDGAFEMMTRGEGAGAPVGKCAVRIVCFGNEPSAAKSDADKNPAPRGEPVPGKSLIPSKYSLFETSGIVVNVRPGQNEPLLLNLTP